MPHLHHIPVDLPRICCLAEQSSRRGSSYSWLAWLIWRVLSSGEADVFCNTELTYLAVCSIANNIALGTLPQDTDNIFANAKATGRWITAVYAMTLATNLTATST